MHELSIAYQLVQAADEAAQRAGATAVERVSVRIGDLSGVVTDALQFSFGIASEGTLLADATLDIEAVPAAIYCAECDATVTLPSIQQFCCPTCGTPSAAVVRGRELELVSLEVREG